MAEGEPKSIEEQIEDIIYPHDGEGLSPFREFAGNPPIDPAVIAVESLKKKTDLPEREMDQN